MDPLLETIKFENPCPGQANGMPAYYFMQVMHMLLASHCTFGNPDDYPTDFGPNLEEGDQFDFVIVGGGSSGSVIANRLTEISKWKILVIEAGGNPTFESDIPGFSVSLPGRVLDWNFSTTRSKSSCLGMENETCSISQGRVLGGTSTINKMHYIRGNPADYNEWESLGNKGWSYEKVLPYFKKSEKLDGDFKIINDVDFGEGYESFKKMNENERKLYAESKTAAGKRHSKGGLMSVNYFAYDYSLSHMKKKLCDAAEELGIPPVLDFNWKSQIGCGQVMGVIHEGSRGNSAKSFLMSAKERKNLFLVKNATVEKLILEGKTVRGVRVLLNEKIISVYANKEVIISAGAINSPRLLLLSGIGPSENLKSVGVDVRHDLPGVGKNLQMHLSFFGLPFVISKENSEPLTHLEKIDAMYQFVSRGVGMFGNVGLNEVVSFANTEKNDSVPDVQFLHYINRVKDYYTFNELLISLNIKDEIRDRFSKIYSTSNLLLISPTLLRPKSRGHVELISPHFMAPPKITSNFLKNNEDFVTLIKGINMALRLTETKAFEEFEAALLKLDIDKCESFTFKSDDYWKCMIEHLATSTSDASGTCKMGPIEDIFAVVDDELKVHGVKGLRVADSSIMPFIVRGSTSVASVMIGEKVSDLIKKDWQKAKRKDEL